MELETFQYHESFGWSVKEFPNLDSEQTFVLIFSSPIYIDNTKPITELTKHFTKSKIIGCSTAGEIAGSSISDKSISVAVAKFKDTHLELVSVPTESTDDSYKAGIEVAKKLNIHNDLRGIFILSEGININGSELVRGLNSIANENLVITGGLAGDGSQFKKTWVIADGKIVTNSVSALGFYGDKIVIEHGSCGGWDIFGPERRITRSKGNILYELDGKPALELYKEYLGEKASGLPATGLLFPLAIRKDKNDTKQLVRTILGIDDATNALIFAGDMPSGNLAQLMRANFERLITGANKAGKLALHNNNFKKNELSSPLLLIAISCVGRRLLLGERTEEEVETLIELFPEKTQQVGFYSYGELSPYAKGNCDLHNQTMTLTTIREKVSS